MRRSVILAVVMILMATGVNAQEDLRPGQMVVSGATALTINRQTFSQEDVKETTTNTSSQLDVGATYFFSNSIGVGMMVVGQNTSVSASGTGSDDKTTVTTYGVGPIVAMRFGSGKVSFNIRGGVGIGKNSMKVGSGDASDNDVKFFQGGGGLSYHINEQASFDVGLRYQKSTIKDPKAEKDTPSTDASGFIVAVGFALYFGGR